MFIIDITKKVVTETKAVLKEGRDFVSYLTSTCAINRYYTELEKQVENAKKLKKELLDDSETNNDNAK